VITRDTGASPSAGIQEGSRITTKIGVFGQEEFGGGDFMGQDWGVYYTRMTEVMVFFSPIILLTQRH